MKKSIVFFGLMLFSVMSYAGPSFNCAKAGNTAEHLICSSERLSEMDEILSSNYKNAVSNGIDVKADQRQWIKERNLCTDERCLEISYSGRNDLLIANLEEKGLVYYTYDQLNRQGASDDDDQEDDSESYNNTNNNSMPSILSSDEVYKLQRVYRDEGLAKYVTLKIISMKNGLVVNKIIINDNSCVLSARPDAIVRPYKMGDEREFILGCRNIIKVDMYTNYGHFVNTSN